MATRIACQNCGAPVDLPAGFGKAKIRCPACGYYAEVPADVRAARTPAALPKPTRRTSGRPAPAQPAPVVAARPRAAPRDRRPQFEPDVAAPAGPPLLKGTRDEDDDQPYGVPGTGTKPCPHCRGQLPLAATVCVFCGRDFATGKVTDRQFEPIKRVWSEGWQPDLRFKVLLAAQAFNGVALVAVLFGGGLSAITFGAVFWNGFFAIFHGAILAYIIGTYDTLRVERTAAGRATVTRVRRIALIALPASKLSWKRSHAVMVVATAGPGVFSWGVFAYLFLLGILPGVIFYFLVMRPDRFEVTFCDVYGGTDEVVHRVQGYDPAAEVARVISTATGLVYRKEL